jgi:chemotaxis protein methyltransferase CheR
VRFQHINLASQDYPSPANDTCNYDIIFCRNIFIYFTPELTTQIINRLFGALNEGGFLIVSPCEYSPQFFARFEALQAGALTLYRRPFQFGKWEAPLAPKPVSHASPAFYKNQPALLTYSPRLSALAPKVTPPLSPARLLEQAREALAGGQFEQARELALKVAAQDALLAESYLLLSSLYQDTGQLDQALEMARRFVYLEPDRPEGQFFLAKLHHSLGLKKRAAQAYRRLLELLGNLHSGLLFPYLAGLSVKELRQLAEQNLAALETC